MRKLYWLLLIVIIPRITVAQNPSIQWQRSYGSTASDRPLSVAKLNSGGYVMVGSNQAANGDATANKGLKDGWIIRTNSTGSIQWQKSLGGNQDDEFTIVRQTGGTIWAGGYSGSNNNGDVPATKGDLDAWIVKLDEAGNVLWQKTWGASGADVISDLIPTADGGCVFVGSTSSTDGNGDPTVPTATQGNSDAWIVKINSSGTIQWQRRVGGNNVDEATSIDATSDGGYVVGAYSTQSSVPDGLSPNNGSADAQIIKISSTGALQWEKKFGGSGREACHFIKQLANGDIFFSGVSSSNDYGLANWGGFDIYGVRLTASGSPLWQRTYGGSVNDSGYDAVENADGTIALVAISNSTDKDLIGGYGADDIWLLKLTSTGSLISTKNYGGTGTDRATCMISSGTGSYIIGGSSTSSDRDVTINKGLDDWWFLEVSEGPPPAQPPTLTWQKSYGSTASDRPLGVAKLASGGYVMVGSNQAANSDATANKGLRDGWIIRTNSTGSIQWQKSLGGNQDDEFITVKQLGSSIWVGGYTGSNNNGDVPATKGDLDAWIVKLDEAGNVLWQKTWGASGADVISDLIPTADGGCVFVGSTNSIDTNGDPIPPSSVQAYQDVWIVKINSSGIIQWQRRVGGNNVDEATSIDATSDGGYVVGAYSTQSSVPDGLSPNNGSADAQIIKISSTGALQWEKKFGGSGREACHFIKQLANGDIFFSGVSSSNDYGLANWGGFDIYGVRLTASGSPLWQRTYGGSVNDSGYDAVENADGTIALVAISNSTDKDLIGGYGADDIWLLKLTSTGSLISTKNYGGTGTDRATCMISSGTGSYIIGGSSTSSDRDVTINKGLDDWWFLEVSEGPISFSTKLTTPVCLGNSIQVPFQPNISFNSGNIFTAQLSDVYGGFSQPTPIGSLATSTAGVISAIIPAGISPGNGYRIRIVGSNPSTIGYITNIPLTLDNSPGPVSIIASPNTICLGSSTVLSVTGCVGGTVQWSTGSTSLSISVSPSATTSYSVICLRNSCSNSSSIPIVVKPIPARPNVISSINPPFCVGTTLQLTASSCNGVIQWNNGTTGNTLPITRE